MNFKACGPVFYLFCLSITFDLLQYFQDDDLVVSKLFESTEEGQKVTRNKGDKYLAVYRRIDDPLLSNPSFSYETF